MTKKLIVVVGVMLIAASAMAQLATSKHDFTGSAWSGGQICRPCHTPHFGTQSTAPLWNHADTTATFTLYTSQTLNATMDQPTGATHGYSKACMACHDGTVALDSFGGTTGTVFIPATGLIGTALTNDHPIAFTYNGTLATADGELKTPTLAGGNTVLRGLLYNVDANGGTLECASCHDVHNKGNLGHMLRMSNAGSALCLTCHTK